MKKFLAIMILFLGVSINFAQGIELPDFVITGVQSVTIPILPKKNPEPISTITHEFIKPLYSPEDFQISEPSAPIKVDAEILKTKQQLNGSLTVAAGINTQPMGEAYFYNTFDKIFLFSKVYGKYIRAYEDNADQSTTGFDFSSKYFIDNKSVILPATKIALSANYERLWYKHFISTTPEFQNKIQLGSAKLMVENTYIKEFNFGASLNATGLFTNSLDYHSSNIWANGYFSSNLNNLNISFEGNYLRQYVSKSAIISYHYDYWNGRAIAKYSPNPSISFGAGLYIADYDTNSFFSPTAFVKVSLNKDLSIDLSFEPTTKYCSVNDFFKENRYINFAGRDNYYEEYKGNLSLTIRYIYLKLMETSVGINIKTIENKFYFTDKIKKGNFDLVSVNDVDAFEVFSNYYFKLGDYGDLFGELVYKNYRMPNDVVLPYTPAFILSTNYKYIYNEFIALTLGLDWKHKTYADDSNLKTLPDYFNLSIKGEYTLYENLGIIVQFENIINNKNYSYLDYLEKPLDIYAGINYKW